MCRGCNTPYIRSMFLSTCSSCIIRTLQFHLSGSLAMLHRAFKQSFIFVSILRCWRQIGRGGDLTRGVSSTLPDSRLRKRNYSGVVIREMCCKLPAQLPPAQLRLIIMFIALLYAQCQKPQVWSAPTLTILNRLCYVRTRIIFMFSLLFIFCWFGHNILSRGNIFRYHARNTWILLLNIFLC